MKEKRKLPKILEIDEEQRLLDCVYHTRIKKGGKNGKNRLGNECR